MKQFFSKDILQIRNMKGTAREQLWNRYSLLIAVYVLTEIIFSGLLGFVRMQIDMFTVGGFWIFQAMNILLTLFTAVFTVGQCLIYLNLAYGRPYTFQDMWFGFKFHPDKAIVANAVIFGIGLLLALPFVFSVTLLITDFTAIRIFICLVCLLIWILPLWYVRIRFSQVFYLLLYHPEDSAIGLLKRSWHLMGGNMLRYFYLDLSLIGVTLLCLLSFGVGFLWGMPYIYLTKTHFYLSLYSPVPVPQPHVNYEV